MTDNKKKFEELEDKILKLIASHRQLKVANEGLRKEITTLTKSVETEKSRVKWVEDGYNSLKEADKSNSGKSINSLQKKLNEIVSEVDKSLSLVDTNIT